MAIITNNINFIYFSNMIVGIALGASGIAITTFILDSAPEENRSTYQALYLMITGISAFAGATFMGLLMQLFSGNHAPTNNELIILFLIASFFRLLTWIAFVFLQESQIAAPTIEQI